MNGEIPLEDEITAVLDLVDVVCPSQRIGLLFLLGELRPHHQRPMVQRFTDHIGAQAVGDSLQGLRVIDASKSVVIFAKADFLSFQFRFHERVPIQVIGLSGHPKPAIDGHLKTGQ